MTSIIFIVLLFSMGNTIYKFEIQNLLRISAQECESDQ